MKCPVCDGDGKLLEEYIDDYPRYLPCGFCRGTGKIWSPIALYWAFREIRENTKQRTRQVKEKV